MHFLPDVYVPCEVCKGKRYNAQTLEVKYKGKTIADVLEMRVDEANEFFAAIPRIHNKLKTICEVGLGYIKMGQPATTLSGGEAQRVKLATELSRRSTGRTFYVLDEPTTGLHFADIHKLLEVLQRLVQTGNTVLVIEHNLDVIKTADYLIDLGPEGGDRGGTVVGTGTPEELAANPAPTPGAYLVPVLEDQRAVGHHRAGRIRARAPGARKLDRARRSCEGRPSRRRSISHRVLGGDARLQRPRALARFLSNGHGAQGSSRIARRTGSSSSLAKGVTLGLASGKRSAGGAARVAAARLHGRERR